MQIADVRITRATMPRVDPSWRTSSYAGSVVEGFLLEIEADGLVGLGGTAAHPSQIGPDELAAQLTGPVRAQLLRADARAGNRARQALRAAGVHSRALLAADLALHDLLGKRADLPCYALWGGATRASLAVVRMVGLKTAADLEAAARTLLEQGFAHLKVKVGTSPAEDAARIRRLREAFGPRLWIAVDGNGAYTPDEAIDLSRALAPYDVRLIEQPIDYRDLDGLARVTAASPIPIMADQYVTDVASALRLCQRRAAHLVSIKATKMGSLDECRRVAELCQAFGIGVHVGGSAGPAVVEAAQAQLAAALPWIDEECAVGAFLAVTGDPSVGVTIRDGRLALGAAGGLGVTRAPVAAAP